MINFYIANNANTNCAIFALFKELRMNWIPYYAKYLNWIGLVVLFLWAIFYWMDIPNFNKIDTPMKIIGFALIVIGMVLEQVNKKKS